MESALIIDAKFQKARDFTPFYLFGILIDYKDVFNTPMNLLFLLKEKHMSALCF